MGVLRRDLGKMEQRLIVLGATGSVGQTTAKVVRSLQGRVSVEGMVAHHNGEKLWERGRELNARWVGLTDLAAASRLKAETDGHGPRILAGMDEILAALADSPKARVLAAMSGFSGLIPTLAAIDRGMDVLLANKETLVAAGALVMERARLSGSQIIPVDSEHSAVFQCLRPDQPFRRIILTCSGGPFRGKTRQALAEVTVADALQHPTWNMGAKITVDSATLMNKGLEVIEAHWLFGARYSQIAVVVHPQSIVHSMVEFEDGAVMAQMGRPDMQVPIEVALAWPERWAIATERLDLAGTSLSFESPDDETFPALNLAREVGRAGGLGPCVMNAANEVAVHAFLEGKLPFLDILAMTRAVVEGWKEPSGSLNLEAIQAGDRWARAMAQDLISARS